MYYYIHYASLELDCIGRVLKHFVSLQLYNSGLISYIIWIRYNMYMHVIYTVEPPNKGHVGDNIKVVLSSEVQNVLEL